MVDAAEKDKNLACSITNAHGIVTIVIQTRNMLTCASERQNFSGESWGAHCWLMYHPQAASVNEEIKC